MFENNFDTNYNYNTKTRKAVEQAMDNTTLIQGISSEQTTNIRSFDGLLLLKFTLYCGILVKQRYCPGPLIITGFLCDKLHCNKL